MNNTLAPIKATTTTTNVSSSQPADLHRTNKLDPITIGKREQTKPEPSKTHRMEETSTNKKSSVDFKALLKGKPIIFVGGGPGRSLVVVLDSLSCLEKLLFGFR